MYPGWGWMTTWWAYSSRICREEPAMAARPTTQADVLFALWQDRAGGCPGQGDRRSSPSPADGFRGPYGPAAPRTSVEGAWASVHGGGEGTGTVVVPRSPSTKASTRTCTPPPHQFDQRSPGVPLITKSRGSIPLSASQEVLQRLTDVAGLPWTVAGRPSAPTTVTVTVSWLMGQAPIAPLSGMPASAMP